ncbi:hypothetical protein [Spiribacter onubensis]|uniref:Aminoglycoside phosphotransferase domain-containing protein n=1 Tax=Spiribacter onubensis TaxID=3122420 RepID=A0ABV3S6A0_9GAMM
MRTPLASQRRMVQSLLTDPSVLDHGPASCIETHFSWVILTRRFAFKLKKALDEPLLHHETPRDRRLACQSEVHLNRRLAADVYIGVIGLCGDAKGRLDRCRDGTVEADEYLVKMVRLHERQNLQWQIRHGRLDPADLDALIDLLAGFYRRSPPEWLSPRAHWQRMQRQVGEEIGELARHSIRPPGLSLDNLGAALRRLGGELRQLIEERVRTGHIHEVHGDLRPEHVYFAGAPMVIDCLEFSRPLRLQDPLEEIAFLAMECERMGATEAAHRLRTRFARTYDEDSPAGLWHFYAARRALLWAVLAIRHRSHSDARGENDWYDRAGDYLALAEGHLNRLTPERNGH